MSPTPTKIRAASATTRATLFVRKIYKTSDGELTSGFASGFIHKNAKGVPFFVTNWHVLTSRYPDDPGTTVNKAPSSPIAIETVFPVAGSPGAWTVPCRLELYNDGLPVWVERGREIGVDIAAIPIVIPEGVDVQFPGEAGKRFSDTLQPGLNTVIVGFPYEQSEERPFAIWKSGIVASEPSYLISGVPQFLIDAGGIPGMSGSPVYIPSAATEYSAEVGKAYESAKESGSSALELISILGSESEPEQGVSMQFVGIYAGATSEKFISGYRFGRAFMGGLVDAVVDAGEAGHNPFPPDFD